MDLDRRSSGYKPKKAILTEFNELIFNSKQSSNNQLFIGYSSNTILVQFV